MAEKIPIPAPVDVRTLDPTEASIAGGLLMARRALAVETIRTLHPEDFTHHGLVAVVRACDVNGRADRPMSIANVSAAAVEGGVIAPRHRAVFDALLVDLTSPDVTMGEPALWCARSLIDRSVRRTVAGTATRAGQAVEEVTDPGELAPALRALAADLVAAADRLEREVIA